MGRRKKSEVLESISEVVNPLEETTNESQSPDNPEQTSPDDFIQPSATVEETAQSAKDDLLEVENIISDFSSAKNEDDEPKKRGRKSKAERQEELIIPGELLVMITDRLTSAGICAVDGMINKQPIDAALLAMDDEQIKKLTPLANKAIEAMKIIDNPIAAFFVSMIAFQIANYIALRIIMKPNAGNNS